jgi:hypothetical protein
MAVWLLSTDSFGLDSTRSVPKVSSSLMAVRKSPRRKARLNRVLPTADGSVEVDGRGLEGAGGRVDPECFACSGALAERASSRALVEVLPVDALLIVLVQPHFDDGGLDQHLASSRWTRTLSRNSWIFSCWREVARAIKKPVSRLTITEAACRVSYSFVAGVCC